jgi:hypothetical protein
MIELIRWIDGEPMASLTATSLILGVPVAQIDELTSTEGPSVGNPSPGFKGYAAPDYWFELGRRRSAQACEQTGSSHVIDVLRYWAAKDYNAEVVEDDDGNVFMTDGDRE